MKKLWFRRKHYGWGWQPATWQGWLVLFLYVVAMIKVVYLFDSNPYSDSNSIIKLVIAYVILTGILIAICFKKGEKPKWQWGKGSIDKTQ